MNKHDRNNATQYLKDFNRNLSLGMYDNYLRYLFLFVSVSFIGCGLWIIS